MFFAVVGARFKFYDFPGLIALSLLCFVHALPGGALMGLVGGAAGTPSAWFWGGVCGAFFSGWVHSWMLADRHTQITEILFVFVALLVAGLAASLMPRSNARCPSRTWVEISENSALNCWDSFNRWMLAGALAMAAVVLGQIAFTGPTFWANRHRIAQIGWSNTLDGSRRTASAQRRMYAPRASCQSNLKQMALAMMQYTQDYNERHPPVAIASNGSPYGWADAIYPYAKNHDIYQCPHDFWTQASTTPQRSGYTDYWFNGNLSSVALKRIKSPAQTFLFGDGNNGSERTDARYSYSTLPTAWQSDPSQPSMRHQNGANYAFADGHVNWLRPCAVGTAPGTALVWN